MTAMTTWPSGGETNAHTREDCPHGFTFGQPQDVVVNAETRIATEVRRAYGQDTHA